MSRNYIEKLKEITPGFKDDKDDSWVPYLSKEDQIQLRKWRAKYLQMIENLDELKLDKTAAAQEKRLTDEINFFIRQTLLSNLSRMKQIAKDAREKAIQEDFSPAKKRSRLDQEAEEVGHELDATRNYLPMDFLPRAPITTKDKGSEARKDLSKTSQKSKNKDDSNKKDRQRQKQTQEKQSEPEADVIDDNAKDEFEREVLAKLKPLIARYHCKDRVLEAIDSFKRYYETIDVLRLVDQASRK